MIVKIDNVLRTRPQAIYVEASISGAEGWKARTWIPRSVVGDGGSIDKDLVRIGQSGTMEVADWWAEKDDVRLLLPNSEADVRVALPKTSLTVKNIARTVVEILRGMAEAEDEETWRAIAMCDCGNCESANNPVSFHCAEVLRNAADKIEEALLK